MGTVATGLEVRFTAAAKGIDPFCIGGLTVAADARPAGPSAESCHRLAMVERADAAGRLGAVP